MEGVELVLILAVLAAGVVVLYFRKEKRQADTLLLEAYFGAETAASASKTYAFLQNLDASFVAAIRGDDDWEERDRRGDTRLARLRTAWFSGDTRMLKARLTEVWERDLREYPGAQLTIFDGERDISLQEFVRLCQAWLLIHGQRFEKERAPALQEA